MKTFTLSTAVLALATSAIAQHGHDAAPSSTPGAAPAAPKKSSGGKGGIFGLGIQASAIGGLIGIVPPSFLGGGIASAFTGMLNRGYGKVADPAGAAPRRVELTPRFDKEIAGAKTVKVRYGPYKVPNMMHKNGVGEGGSLWNYADKRVDKPCDKCIIVGMNAGLEYPDGTVANIDTDAWLHHFVLFNIGPGRKDATCAGKTSLPHLNVDSDANNSERMFSSGNERTPAFLTTWAGAGIKPVGYHVKPTDKFGIIVDLMNDSAKDKVLYLTISYDYVEGHPAGFDDMRPVWFDVDQCALSEVKPLKESGAFTIQAKAWTANMDGEILGYAGHLHDGGQRVVLSVDGKKVCTSEATYGGDKAYLASGAPMMNPNSATVHISKMSICAGPTLNTRNMKQGQSWTLTADYDYDKSKGMLHEDGDQEDIMGIAIMYVRQPWNG